MNVAHIRPKGALAAAMDGLISGPTPPPVDRDVFATLGLAPGVHVRLKKSGPLDANEPRERTGTVESVHPRFVAVRVTQGYLVTVNAHDIVTGRVHIQILEERAAMQNETPPVRKTRIQIAREKLSREDYLRHKTEDGMTDRAVRERYEIAADVLVKLKEEWGLVGGFECFSNPADAQSPVGPPAGEPENEGASCPFFTAEHVRGMVEHSVREHLLATIAEIHGVMDRVEQIQRCLSEVQNAADMIMYRDVKGLAELSEAFRRHRHQVGAGHWSGRPEG